jgi:diaminopimelate epimerase
MIEGRPFLKMHGLGNDFVVLDARRQPLSLRPEEAALLADRRRGIGCDQVILLEGAAGDTDLFMRIFNADGSEAEACGNATRCVAALILAESGRDQARIATLGGLRTAWREAAGAITVDMESPGLAWNEVPLAEERDTHRLAFALGPLADPCALSMGNPHVVFFVEDVAAIDLARWGPEIERHPLFPCRTNVQLVQALPDGTLRQRIWERGAGLTQASGSGACAAIVAAVRRGVVAQRMATVQQPGGALTLQWREDGHVLMTGPVATSFHGRLDPSLLAGARP